MFPISNLQIELHTTDNAWKPDRMAGPPKAGEQNGEETEMQVQCSLHSLL